MTSAGRIFVADAGNNVIRVGDLSAQPVSLAIASLSPVPNAGDTVTFSAPALIDGATFRWQRNGTSLPLTVGPTLALTNFQSANAGLYDYTVTLPGGANGTSDPSIIGLSTSTKVIGAGAELRPVDIRHPNGNTFDQVLLTGTGETITADVNQITRTSFIDLNNDIVQIEFAGAGALSLVLEDSSGPAAPVNYNQPTVAYMKGHAGIVITGANETTNLTIFTVGQATAFDPTGAFDILSPVSSTNVPANNGSSLFQGMTTTNYDGVADIAFIAIASTNGKFGGLRASNASCFATRGYTGVYAPGVQFTGPVFIGDINASDSATPMLIIGSSPDTRITGGDLLQANGVPIKVSGLTQLKFTAGSTSHGSADLPAQANKAVLKQGSTDVTAQIVVNPVP